MEEIEKKNEAGSETSKEETKSRREFLKSAAIQGAVAALFGAVTFDSVMAKAMERVGDIQNANNIGRNAVNRLDRYGMNPQSTTCPTYLCTKPDYNCDGSTQTCNPVTQAFSCGGGGQLYSCYNEDFYCYSFTCFGFSCKANGFNAGNGNGCVNDNFHCFNSYVTPC